MAGRVYCAVRTDSLYKTDYVSSLKVKVLFWYLPKELSKFRRPSAIKVTVYEMQDRGFIPVTARGILFFSKFRRAPEEIYHKIQAELETNNWPSHPPSHHPSEALWRAVKAKG